MAELLQNPFAVHLVLKKLITTNVLELRSGLWEIFNLFRVSEVNADSCPHGLRGFELLVAYISHAMKRRA